MAALLAGQGVSETAKAYNLPHQTVSRMKATLDKKLSETGAKKEIGVLVMDLLEAKLETLKAIVGAVANPDYLQKQGASEIAVLYGVLADKAFRILSALESDK